MQVSWDEAEAEEEGDEEAEEYDPEADAALVEGLSLGEEEDEDDDTMKAVDFPLPAALQAAGVPHKPFGALPAGWILVDSKRYEGKWYFYHQGLGERRWWTNPPGEEAPAAVVANEDAEREAEACKLRGNDAFKAGDYEGSISHYGAGIACWPSIVLFQNRAMANLKQECWGAVIADCNSAIAMDSASPKAYFRRACAWIGLGRLQDAVNDFEEVSRLLPNDKLSRAKLAECRESLRKEQFSAVLEGNADSRAGLLAKSIRLDGMKIPASYTGPVLGASPTAEEVVQMMEWFKESKTIPSRSLCEMLLASRALLESLPSLVRCNVPTGGGRAFTVCGDTHGQFYDLLNIFKINGNPSPTNPYLFNGDFVDRGSFSTEVIITLLAWKLVCPDSVHLLRGNHETIQMNKIYGFEGEVLHKYNDAANSLFTEVFNVLPLAACLESKVFICHGGLFTQDGVTLDMITAIPRDRQPPESGLMHDLLWADPQESMGRSPSKRGAGLQFGPDVTQAFLDLNGLEMVIRSHEVKPRGYEVTHGGRLVTVFSAPNYCDQMGNLGAYIRFDAACKPTYHSFRHVPHPRIGPMAYASNFGMMFGGFGGGF